MFYRRKLANLISKNVSFPCNFKLWNLLGKPPIAVTFTGGLGAQVISTAIYTMLKKAGLPVYADFSYFNRPCRVNKGNLRDGLSIFPWQLTELGVLQESFTVFSAKSVPWFAIEDGPVKLALFLEAANDPAIRKMLSTAYNPGFIEDFVPTELRDKRYGCVHIRRGDYVSVASHITSDSQLAKASSLWDNDVDLVVVLSDSPIGQESRKYYQELSQKTYFFADDLSPISSFVIMQNAKYLICSNSQFSLSAGMCAGLPMLLPSRWYSYPDKTLFSCTRPGQLAQLEALLIKCSSFMLVTPPPREKKQTSITDRSSFFRFIAAC
jgi:hypothetical protein